MSISSIARQKRRKRQSQLPPIPYSDSEPHVTLSSISDHSVIHAGLYEQSSNVTSEKAEGSVSDFGSKLDVREVTVPFPASTGCSYINCDVSSRPIGKIFIEDERGFRAIDASQLFQSLNNEKLQQTASKTELAIDLAYKAERYFHNFSFLCHGLLGGISLIETLLLVHLICISSEQGETMTHFRFLSQPIHNLFNFFCIICCVSVFDRFDIGNPKHIFNYVKKCKLKIILLIIYPVCLILSLSTANVDERLCLPEKNSTVWESFKHEDAENELFYWKTLSISKCVGALLAWIIISLEPNHNLFLQHLKNVLQRSAINSN